MQRLIFLGTGNAAVKKCYNTCFAVETDGKYFLVDAGGGNRILAQLENSGIAVDRVRHIFLSHAHSDHILGVVWMLRMICEKMVYFGYRGEAHVYCHDELMDQLVTIMRITTTEKVTALLGDRVVLHRVVDGEEMEIPAGNIRFFDIGSTKLRQYGLFCGCGTGKSWSLSATSRVGIMRGRWRRMRTGCCTRRFVCMGRGRSISPMTSTTSR